jgi:hypothetical protein
VERFLLCWAEPDTDGSARLVVKTGQAMDNFSFALLAGISYSTLAGSPSASFVSFLGLFHKRDIPWQDPATHDDCVVALRA